MSESIDYLHEVFDAFGPIRAGRLYLKTDAHNVAQFEAAGSEPFTYMQREKAVKLSYWSAPEAVLDDREEARFWGRTSFEAALRAQAAKNKPKR